MSTLTIPRSVTSQEVVQGLRDGLDPSFTVLRGMWIRRSPLSGKTRPSGLELIAVTGGALAQAP